MQTTEKRVTEKRVAEKRVAEKQAVKKGCRLVDRHTDMSQAARPYLYFAYGSNLNLEQLGWRCPTAQPVSRLTLPDWQLEFRGVADIVPCPGAEVVGALYSICSADELALDRYEGFRRQSPDAGMYRKVFLPIQDKRGRKRTMMFYVMNRAGLWPPSEGYLETIRQGYADWGLPIGTLTAAVERTCPHLPEGEDWSEREGGWEHEWKDTLTGDLFGTEA